MARKRIGTLELARLLDAAAQPIYVLDEEQTLIFCNQPCLDWVGREAADLQGRRCRYHSRAETAEEDLVAAGLCPPPSAWTGRDSVGVVGCTRPDGGLSRRRARFVPLPLGQPGQAHGLVVLVDSDDLDGSEAATPQASDPEAAQLHERIRAFRCERAARFRCESLAGGSPAIRRAQAQAEVAAGSRASVLIVGPPGSGRQHLASAIHYAGNAEGLGPLVPLACSILDADLIRSTLAALATQGLSGGSHGGGTLLLNEVDALPLEVQYEVAQALTGRTFPLRIIATARRRLEDLVAEQAFREELASSLSTLVIELPPLAQRLGDLPMLLQWFVEEANARGDKQVGGFAAEAVDLLHTHSWPGNLDELAKVVREAHKSAEGAEIGLRDLPESIHQALRAAAYPRRQEEKIVLEEYLARIERELLRRAMRRAKGNKTKAASLLGLTRPRLYRRLVQLGLVTEGEKEG